MVIIESDLSVKFVLICGFSIDYHGGWEAETGHVSPLYGRPGDKYPQYNTDYTMQLLVKEGAAREKLIMGKFCWSTTRRKNFRIYIEGLSFQVFRSMAKVLC